MGARKLKGGNMSRAKKIADAIKKAAPAIKGGYAAAKNAIGKITKKTDLDKLAEQIRKQSKLRQQPGKRLSKTAQEARKQMTSKGNVSRFVERRKQLRGRKPKTAGTLGTYGVGVAAGSGATALGMKHRQKKKARQVMRKK
tara:strand:+ start:133 stop:555 length:423 start_codon:yes stop_codon:yes gene_type:complete